MNIDQETVKKIAHLARLDASKAQLDQWQHDLTIILEWMDQLQQVDTTGVEPLTHMSDEVNVFRADVANNTLSREKALQNAPSTDGQYFIVPKVLE